jgi:hypothetical protein
VKHRLRFAEKFAAVSALALVGILFLDWFAGPVGLEGAHFARTGWTAYAPAGSGGVSGWHSLGWLALALCLLAVVAGLALPFVFAAYDSPVLPLFGAISAMLLGGLAVVALLVQVVAQPGPDEYVSVEAGWWLGLLAAAGIARGGFLSMRDEYLPGVPVADVPVRPAPPAVPAA